MRSWTIAFSLGVVAASILPQLPAPPVALLTLLIGALLHYWKPLRVPAALLTGIGWLCCTGQWHLQQRWPEPPFPRDAWVEGTVWTIPVATERGQRFRFRLDHVCTEPVLARCDFAAMQHDGRMALLTLYEPLVIEPGQRWRWKLRLRPPHGFANPGGFDYEAWLMQQGIDATGYVREADTGTLLQDAGMRRLFEQARLRCIRFLESAGAGRLHYTHLLRALAVGDGSDISDEEWELFSDTGTTHLLVISGSHVALICLWLFAIGYWLSSRSVWLLMRVPASCCAAAIALLGAWAYAGLAGFSLPALRALIMAALTLLAVLLRRHCNPLNNLCLALATILAFDPLAAQNPGFWLSFVAVAVLLHTAPPVTTTDEAAANSWLQRAWKTTRYFLLLQWQLSLALLPVLLLYFQQTSLLAPIVNLLAVPVIGWLIVPLTLLGMLAGLIWPWAGLWLLAGADRLLHLMMLALRFSTELLPANALILPALTLTGMLLLCAATLGAVVSRRIWQRGVCLALLPMCLLLRAPSMPEGSVRMTVLDVGQGLAVIVSTRQHHLLYDSGPLYSKRFDAGSDVVIPALRGQNIGQLDMVVISHADADHAGGLPGIVEDFPAANYRAPDVSLFTPQLDSSACAAGDSWRWDGVLFRFLHPDSSRHYDDNNGSCVLLIEAAGRRLLLTGDIERGVETRLLAQYPDLEADVVIAPHHGSRSSSSPAFVRKLDAEHVVFSSGYQNRFNHPAQDVVQRYENQGSRAFGTASSGAVTITISADGQLEVTEQRQLRRRFWSIGPPQ